MARKAKKALRRAIRCYQCGRRFEVSARTMSTTCPGCHKAIKVEDVRVKTYLGLIDLKTCGRISITRRGRVAARIIQSGEGIECEGAMEGSVETDGPIQLGPRSSWKGRTLQSRTLTVADGATLLGNVNVPWVREEP
ncbi:MAG: polymer-forming cytoskeletal protein [Planctomycetota bacterium]|nr:polymer-forming cytoskeletal protein [Planctomycetota bacterium]